MRRRTQITGILYRTQAFFTIAGALGISAGELFTVPKEQSFCWKGAIILVVAWILA
jgi:hypothetical protein